MIARYLTIVALIVAGVAGFFLLTTPRDAPASKAVPAPAWQSTVDDPGVTPELVWAVNGSPDRGCYPQRLIEQRFNVRLRVETVASAEAYETQLPLRLAAGDVPDVFGPGSAAMLRTYAHHGLLMSLPPALLKAYAPHLVRTISTYAPEAWANTTYDGVNYGIPGLWYDGAFPRTPMWRADWLRNVGITTVPDTLEQMHEALRRFRDDDPDRDGRQDTWGMSGDLMGWYTSFTEIFGAYGVLPFDWMLRDGNVVWGGVLPETRQALLLLRSWYAQGLIHADFVTDRWSDEVPQKLYSGRIGYVNYLSSYEAFDLGNPNSAVSMLRQLTPAADVVPGKPPLGPTGKRGMRVWSAGWAPVAFGRQMAQRPADVIRVLRMLETLATDQDLYIRTRLGEPGVQWRLVDPAKGPVGGVRAIPPYDQKAVADANALLPPMFLSSAAPFGGIGGSPELFRDYLPPGLARFQEEHRNPAWGLKDLFGQPDAVPGAADYLGDLVQMQQTVFAKVIRGEAPIEAYDRFVGQWHAQGGDALLTSAQAYYALQQRLLAELAVPPADGTR